MIEKISKIGYVLMASGFSKRMGKNKLLMEYKGKPLIAHTFEKFSADMRQNAVVITQYDEIIELAKVHNLPYIYNKNACEGQSAAIKLGIKALSKDYKGYMFIACDQPNISSTLLKKLEEAFDANPNNIICPFCNGKRGSPAIFPECFRSELMGLSGDIGGRNIIMANRELIFAVAADAKELLDIDNPKDINML